jgi:hypothetical protein
VPKDAALAVTIGERAGPWLSYASGEVTPVIPKGYVVSPRETITDNEFAAFRVPPIVSTRILHRYVVPVVGTHGLVT